MDEIELRLAAVELLLIELGAWLPAEALEDAATSINAGIQAGCDPEERTVRLSALELLKDARGRYRGVSG